MYDATLTQVSLYMYYTPQVEKGTVRVKCLAQEHHTETPLPKKGSHPGLDPESSALTLGRPASLTCTYQ